MTREWVASHGVKYLLLMAAWGIFLGIVAIYLISFILAIYKLGEIVLATLSGGPAGG